MAKKTTKGKGRKTSTKGSAGAKRRCTVSARATTAGHRLATERHSPSGKTLATAAKKEKSARMKRGCLAGPPKTFRLTAAQKRKLSPAMQKGLIRYHRSLGKKILK